MVHHVAFPFSSPWSNQTRHARPVPGKVFYWNRQLPQENSSSSKLFYCTRRFNPESWAYLSSCAYKLSKQTSTVMVLLRKGVLTSGVHMYTLHNFVILFIYNFIYLSNSVLSLPSIGAVE